MAAFHTMRWKSFWILLSIVYVLPTISTECHARQRNENKIIVGTKVALPFSFKNNSGQWEGISIQLWREIAAELNLEYELREYTLAGLIEGLEKQTIDVVAAAITITPQRERSIDFSHPFYTAGLGIAVRAGEKEGWLGALDRILSLDFFKIVGALALLIGLMGTLTWFFERRANEEQFGGHPAKGLWQGFWWSAVTMTTVGYGDKAPKTLGGRIVGLIWMFTAVIVISSFTAAITSSLTVSKITPGIKGPSDLTKVKVGTIDKTTSSIYLEKNHISFHPYKDMDEALQSLLAGKVDAFVYDAPILRYTIATKRLDQLTVLKETFGKQPYGLGLQAGSLLREPINLALLEQIEKPAWQDLLFKYLGD